MKLVVDTNILFSALLGGKTSKTFARAIINLKLHTTNTTVEELRRHKEKIIRHSTLTPETLETALNEILAEDVILHDTIEIPGEIKDRAKELVRDVDPDDWPFVALAMFLGVPLWTGDRKLLELSVRTGFRYFTTVDTEGVEMLLEGKSLEEVKRRMIEKYG